MTCLPRQRQGLEIDRIGLEFDMSGRQKIIVLDYESAKVTVLTPDESCVRDEDFIQEWCEQTGTRYGNINWMSWSGSIDSQCFAETNCSMDSNN